MNCLHNCFFQCNNGMQQLISMMYIHWQSLTGSEKKWYVVYNKLQKTCKTNNHLQSKTDNENNYNSIFILNQNIGENIYKSLIFQVIISCCQLLLFFLYLADFVQTLSAPIHNMLTYFYPQYFYFRYQNTKKTVLYRYCFRVHISRCMTLCRIFSLVMATISADFSDCTKYTLTI